MTGGSDESKKINETLALTAEELRLPMGVGSQRAGLVADDLIGSYAIVRDSAPTAFGTIVTERILDFVGLSLIIILTIVVYLSLIHI